MNATLRTMVTLAVVAVVATLWLQRCTGADPEVREVRVEAPAEPGSPYVVEATVVNHRGPGEVKVIVRLRDRQLGAVYGEETKIRMDDGETLHVAVEVQAPMGDYEAWVTADYPPQ